MFACVSIYAYCLWAHAADALRAKKSNQFGMKASQIARK